MQSTKSEKAEAPSLSGDVPQPCWENAWVQATTKPPET